MVILAATPVKRQRNAAWQIEDRVRRRRLGEFLSVAALQEIFTLPDIQSQ